MNSHLPKLPRIVRWRILRWVLATPLVPFLLWACNSHPFESPNPQPQQETDQYFPINPERRLDVLFMIDNSPSMEQEQDNLKRNFPVFMEELNKIPQVDLHIGVISSDLGAGPSGIQGGCGRVGGDRGILQAKTGCGLQDPMAKYLVHADDGKVKNYSGDLATVFGCMASLGVGGCGFEHQLQAARVALREDWTKENTGFLRKEAYLGVILVTDEDDCSALPSSDLFTQDMPGQQASLRCNLEGHLCSGKRPMAVENWVSKFSDCTPSTGSKLIDVAEIINDIRARKARPDEQILVAGIFGWPSSEIDAEYKIIKNAGGDLEVKPTCQSTNGSAAPGLRMKSFVDGFGASGSFYRICQDDFRDAMKEIGERLRVLIPDPCVAAPLVDTSPDSGLQADCQVADRVLEGGVYKDHPIKSCALSNNEKPCWAPVEDSTCKEAGYKIMVQRTAPAPVGTQQVIKCLTCAKDDPERCPRP